MNTKLKTAIIESGIKQCAIAQKAGLDETQLSKIIYGRRKASPEELEKIAAVLHMKVDEIV